jgi:hypothetical protein
VHCLHISGVKCVRRTHVHTPAVTQVMSPFIYNATRDMLASSFKSPDMELPRRMAANPQLYAKVLSLPTWLLVNESDTAPGSPGVRPSRGRDMHLPLSCSYTWQSRHSAETSAVDLSMPVCWPLFRASSCTLCLLFLC